MRSAHLRLMNMLFVALCECKLNVWNVNVIALTHAERTIGPAVWIKCLHLWKQTTTPMFRGNSTCQSLFLHCEKRREGREACRNTKVTGSSPRMSSAWRTTVLDSCRLCHTEIMSIHFCDILQPTNAGENISLIPDTKKTTLFPSLLVHLSSVCSDGM